MNLKFGYDEALTIFEKGYSTWNTNPASKPALLIPALGRRVCYHTITAKTVEDTIHHIHALFNNSSWVKVAKKLHHKIRNNGGPFPFNNVRDIEKTDWDNYINPLKNGVPELFKSHDTKNQLLSIFVSICTGIYNHPDHMHLPERIIDFYCSCFCLTYLWVGSSKPKFK